MPRGEGQRTRATACQGRGAGQVGGAEGRLTAAPCASTTRHGAARGGSWGWAEPASYGAARHLGAPHACLQKRRACLRRHVVPTLPASSTRAARIHHPAVTTSGEALKRGGRSSRRRRG